MRSRCARHPLGAARDAARGYRRTAATRPRPTRTRPRLSHPVATVTGYGAPSDHPHRPHARRARGGRHARAVGRPRRPDVVGPRAGRGDRAAGAHRVPRRAVGAGRHPQPQPRPAGRHGVVRPGRAGGGGDLGRPPVASLSVVLFDTARRRVNARLTDAGGRGAHDRRHRGAAAGAGSPGTTGAAGCSCRCPTSTPPSRSGGWPPTATACCARSTARACSPGRRRLARPRAAAAARPRHQPGQRRRARRARRAAAVGHRVHGGRRADVRVQGARAPRSVAWGLRAVGGRGGRRRAAGAGRRRHHRPGRLRRRGHRPGGRHARRAGAHRHRPRHRPLGGRRGRARRVQDADRLRPGGGGRRPGRRGPHRRRAGGASSPPPGAAASDEAERLRTCGRHVALATRQGLVAADRDLAGRGVRRRARPPTGALGRATAALDRAAGRVEAGGRAHLRTHEHDGGRRGAPGWRSGRRGCWPRPSATSASVDAQVRALDPQRVLARGWSITRTRRRAHPAVRRRCRPRRRAGHHAGRRLGAQYRLGRPGPRRPRCPGAPHDRHPLARPVVLLARGLARRRVSRRRRRDQLRRRPGRARRHPPRARRRRGRRRRAGRPGPTGGRAAPPVPVPHRRAPASRSSRSWASSRPRSTRAADDDLDEADGPTTATTRTSTTTHDGARRRTTRPSTTTQAERRRLVEAATSPRPGRPRDPDRGDPTQAGARRAVSRSAGRSRDSGRSGGPRRADRARPVAGSGRRRSGAHRPSTITRSPSTRTSVISPAGPGSSSAPNAPRMPSSSPRSAVTPERSAPPSPTSTRAWTTIAALRPGEDDHVTLLAARRSAGTSAVRAS